MPTIVNNLSGAALESGVRKDFTSGFLNLVSGPDTETGAAFAAGAATAIPTTFGDDAPVTVFVLPDGWRAETVDPADYGDHPRRALTRNTVVTDVGSFIHACQLFTGFDADGGPVVYADTVGFSAIGILNDDGDQAGHRDRRVTLKLTHTPEWNRWVGANNNLIGQHDFAEFIEDNIADIAAPSGADLLEIVASLEATSNVNFRSSVRLTSGVRQFEYAETVEARAAGGTLEIPDTFGLALAPWVGSERLAVTARLRYRVSDNGLRLGFRLQHTDRILRDAFNNDVLAPILTAFPNVVNGTP